MEIMKNVDFLDLVEIVVYRGSPTKENPCPLMVHFEPNDKGKNIVFDPAALKTLNDNITDRVLEMSLSLYDPNTIEYIKEFIGRLVSEMHRNGVVVLDDVGEGDSDPYASVRKTPAKLN